MTAERFRLPIGKAALALAYDGEPAATHDLFPAPVADPHPDFAARADIWREHAAGLISLAEAQRKSANVGRAVATKAERKAAPVRPRHQRPAPNDSRQYAGDMATTAARDDRLTPNAKALLQVIRARCGKGRRTEITKGTMGAVMSRSARTIRRYLFDLARFGYITLDIRRTAKGLHTGLIVTVTEKTLPFYEQADALASWLASTPEALALPFAGRVLGGNARVTLPTLKKQTPIIPILQKLRNGFREGSGASAVSAI